MANQTDITCGNCGKQTVLFCDNMFTDFACTTCGATNLTATLPKIETVVKCKEGYVHDIRIARDNKLFCPKCHTELGVLKLE